MRHILLITSDNIKSYYLGSLCNYGSTFDGQDYLNHQQIKFIFLNKT